MLFNPIHVEADREKNFSIKQLVMGEVVDNNDPQKTLRVKAKVDVLHDSFSKEDIPWAYPFIPPMLGTGKNGFRVEIPREGNKVWLYMVNENTYYYMAQLVSENDLAKQEPYKKYFVEDSYPDVYGFSDEIGNIMVTNMKDQFTAYRHCSGSILLIEKNGHVTIYTPDNKSDVQINISGKQMNMNVKGDITFQNEGKTMWNASKGFEFTTSPQIQYDEPNIVAKSGIDDRSGGGAPPEGGYNTSGGEGASGVAGGAGGSESGGMSGDASNIASGDTSGASSDMGGASGDSSSGSSSNSSGSSNSSNGSSSDSSSSNSSNSNSEGSKSDSKSSSSNADKSNSDKSTSSKQSDSSAKNVAGSESSAKETANQATADKKDAVNEAKTEASENVTEAASNSSENKESFTEKRIKENQEAKEASMVSQEEADEINKRRVRYSTQDETYSQKVGRSIDAISSNDNSKLRTKGNTTYKKGWFS